MEPAKPPDPLLELAEVRTETVEIAGYPCIVREPSALENIEFKLRSIKNKAEGMAYLLSSCVLRDDHTPRWSYDEALKVATGRAEVFVPMVNAITSFLTREKKVSPPASSSTSG